MISIYLESMHIQKLTEAHSGPVRPLAPPGVRPTSARAMGKGARQFGKSKSHSKSTRPERKGYDGSRPNFASPEISLLMGSRGAGGGAGGFESAPEPRQPAAAAAKVVTAAAKARHQRKKHNRWQKNQEAWSAQQKLIEKKERPPKAVAAPKVVEMPPAEADALPTAGNAPVARPAGATTTPTDSKLAKAARRQAVRKAKRREEAGAPPLAAAASASASAGSASAAPAARPAASPGAPPPQGEPRDGSSTLAMGVRALDLSIGSGAVVVERKTVRLRQARNREAQPHRHTLAYQPRPALRPSPKKLTPRTLVIPQPRCVSPMWGGSARAAARSSTRAPLLSSWARARSSRAGTLAWSACAPVGGGG